MSEYIIETHNLTKRYGNQVSVSNLNIHVKQGRIYGLLGRNGAGKTTTMRMLLGLTAPTSGEVKIFGRPMQGKNRLSINDSPHTMTSDFLNFGNPAAVDFLSIGLLD